MIQINSIFKEIFTTKKRFILLTGGRGSSKTYNVNTFLCLLSFEQKQRILSTRYTLTSAEQSIIPEFRKKIDAMEVPHLFNITTHEITNTSSKSSIIFSGIKASSGLQTAKLKGFDATTWVNDETEEFRESETFDDINWSIRTNEAQNRVIMILNPTDTGHWIYQRWIKDTHEIKYFDGFPVEISTHPEVLHIHSTYLDNLLFLNESFLKDIKILKESNPKYYGLKIIGQWNGVAEGAIFNRNEINTYKEAKFEYEANIAYIDVSDAGSDYTVAIIGKLFNGKIHITDIYFSNENADITSGGCALLLKENKASYCRVESNSMGAMFARNLQKVVPETQILTATSTANKHTRILMDMPFIMNYFMFKDASERTPMYENAMIQLFNYTKDGKAKHDDVADAMSGLAIFYRGLFPNKFI